MYQFFVEDEQVRENIIDITGSDVNHIKNVLRMKTGEKIRISTKSGKAYFCHVADISDMAVAACIDSEDTIGTELDNEIVLFQGLPKGDKMELIIQKAVELGVSSVVPIVMKNCVAKLDDKKANKKIERWQAIAQSAAKQSKRTRIPKICMPMSYENVLKESSMFDVVLVPYENERGMDETRRILSSIERDTKIAVIIGPEGGFAPQEIEAADKLSNAHRISLGRRILRTETAAIATLAMLGFCLDD